MDRNSAERKGWLALNKRMSFQLCLPSHLFNINNDRKMKEITIGMSRRKPFFLLSYCKGVAIFSYPPASSCSINLASLLGKRTIFFVASNSTDAFIEKCSIDKETWISSWLQAIVPSWGAQGRGALDCPVFLEFHLRILLRCFANCQILLELWKASGQE